RRRTSREQHKTLEDTFQANPKPNSKVRHALADQLSMPVRSVQVWFQNRRAKAK
ncbi:homeobox domain-containing protein, partial [Phycomyces nitens]